MKQKGSKSQVLKEEKDSNTFTYKEIQKRIVEDIMSDEEEDSLNMDAHIR